jgi:hypothetical protein
VTRSEIPGVLGESCDFAGLLRDSEKYLFASLPVPKPARIAALSGLLDAPGKGDPDDIFEYILRQKLAVHVQKYCPSTSSSGLGAGCRTCSTRSRPIWTLRSSFEAEEGAGSNGVLRDAVAAAVHQIVADYFTVPTQGGCDKYLQN